ncbi:MAG: hypothetical protein PHC62_00700 [Candidatus Izemoplasmatales bacterium]|nr:hypothetical protein [Candidatus Izemoplasmatales bacterium]
MNPRTIHETAFLDILATIGSAVFDAGKVRDMDDKEKAKQSGIARAYSLSRATSALTMVCPTLISSSISIDAATIINKSIEKKWVAMMQIALSAYNMSNAPNAVEFIKDFHTNVNAAKLDLDDFMDIADNAAMRIDPHLSKLRESTDYNTMAAIVEDCKRNINFVFEEDFSESSISDFVYKRNGMEDMVIEADTRDKDMQSAKDRFDQDRTARSANMDTFKNQLTTSDVKKANELVPSMMIVNYMNRDPNGEVRNNQAMIGVKSKIYPIDPNEMTNKIISKNADNNFLMKLVKVSTREISFFKDFVFGIDQAKIDAISKSKRGSASKLFKVLERRSLTGRVRKVLGRSNITKPIFSICISREEADYLKNYNNVEVDSPKVIIPIMEKLNLMYFVIVDEANETAKFLLDGDTEYETLSFSSLEKEVSDGGYRKVVNLMSKMSR